MLLVDKTIVEMKLAGRTGVEDYANVAVVS